MANYYERGIYDLPRGSLSSGHSLMFLSVPNHTMTAPEDGGHHHSLRSHLSFSASKPEALASPGLSSRRCAGIRHSSADPSLRIPEPPNPLSRYVFPLPQPWLPPRIHAAQIENSEKSHRASLEYYHDCSSVSTRCILRH
jgi:hypothetical protein